MPDLCGTKGCRRLVGHGGNHDERPTEVWDFFVDKDKNKISKAGFATPRGGAKGAYQNHVARDSKVILPFERLGDVDLGLYVDGYVVRLLPEQYFAGYKTPKDEFRLAGAEIRVGDNAFVLYRTHEVLDRLPPMDDWTVRALHRNGQAVTRRGGGAIDSGHYVIRAPRLAGRAKRVEGPPQGIFAPEYADDDTNFLCKCILAWLIVQVNGSPYAMTQAAHLREILRAEGLDDLGEYERRGVLRRNLVSCPLCMRHLSYAELHSTVSFDDEGGLENAGVQIEGATRSTIVNLFHILPLRYHELTHMPVNIGWGHAVCNTRLGQRPCYSLAELVEMNRKVGIVLEEGAIETFGWVSTDWLMIRSPNGAVWMQLNGDIAEGAPEEPEVFDCVAEPGPEPEVEVEGMTGTEGDETS